MGAINLPELVEEKDKQTGDNARVRRTAVSNQAYKTP